MQNEIRLFKKGDIVVFIFDGIETECTVIENTEYRIIVRKNRTKEIVNIAKYYMN